MKSTDVHHTLKKIIIQYNPQENKENEDQLTLPTSSLAWLKIWMELEQQFEVEIDLEDLKEEHAHLTIQHIVHVIQQQLRQKEST
ncbi:hypothetical protein [Longirhabdus pacifica]|uniref:hypothetical protein n=1 Tax=Longirhabdus pacifica TaxID=2305227 RepID=UPI001008E21B|nr:hypothetical protein [Longirhabdus pacifica]